MQRRVQLMVQQLRILAHLSGDIRLQQLLGTAGPAGDVFCAIAAAWLRNNACKESINQLTCSVST